MFISIDVGIKNLAYIVFDGNKIIEWNVVELCDKKMNAGKINMIEIGIGLYNALEKINHEIDTILIENQIGQNAIRMKSIQGMITFYYISKGKTNIIYWNPINKLKKYNQKEKKTYAQRKKDSIAITKLLIHEHFSDFEGYFNSHKKKDDLADCFLQLIDYLDKEQKLTDTFFEESIKKYNAIDLK
jgi:hypothetical protein